MECRFSWEKTAFRPSAWHTPTGGNALSGGFFLVGFVFASGGAAAEGLFVALELVEGAGGLAGAVCDGFTVGLLGGKAS